MALEKPDLQGLARRLFPPGSPQRLELVRAAWPLAVGPDLARRTEVLAIEGRTLRVRVPDASWRKVLHRLRGQILGQLAAVAGSAAPDRLGFQEAPLRDVAAVPGPALRVAPAAHDPAPPPALVREAEAITDPDLRRAFLDVAARYLARGAANSTENDHA
jgi:Dna[CI] antecedent DciA-like protein